MASIRVLSRRLPQYICPLIHHTAAPSKTVWRRAITTKTEESDPSPLFRRNLPGVKVRSALTQRAPKYQAEETIVDDEHVNVDAAETGESSITKKPRKTAVKRSTATGKGSKLKPRRTKKDDDDDDDGDYEQAKDDSYVPKPYGETLESLNLVREQVLETAVACSLDDGFMLGKNLVVERSGVILCGGEIFGWFPSKTAKSQLGSASPPDEIMHFKLDKDKNGCWTMPPTALSIFAALPRKPDILVIGTGAVFVPLAPDVRDRIHRLGIQIEISDTRNASANYNLLASERGELNVAAMMVPIGFQ